MNQVRVRKKRSQAVYAVVVGAGALFVALTLSWYHPRLTFLWLFGLGFGYVLHRSRFCFAAAFRDLVLFRDGTLLRAVLTAVLVSTVGFAFVQLLYLNRALPLPGFVLPAGAHTAFGAVIFGVGMVLASGCACGTLARMGEGFVMHWVVMAGFIVGSLAGAYHYGWFMEALGGGIRAFFPDYVGWPAAVVLQVGVLVLLYLAVQQRERWDGSWRR